MITLLVSADNACIPNGGMENLPISVFFTSMRQSRGVID
jgi:hypothetical protein